MWFVKDVFSWLWQNEKEIELVRLWEKKSLQKHGDKTEAIVCDVAYRNKSAGFVLSILSIQRYRCHLFRFRGLLSRRWVDCGNSERTGAALCLKGSDWPPYRHSFITGNGLNTWREEQSRPSVQGFCSLIHSQDLRGSCSHCWLAKLKRWNDANSGASSAHSISVSPLKYETDTVPDWNPEFVNGRAPQEAYLRIPLCVSSRPHLHVAPFATASSYTFPELTNVSAKATTNYIKKATAVTAASLLGYSNT